MNVGLGLIDFISIKMNKKVLSYQVKSYQKTTLIYSLTRLSNYQDI